MLCLSALLMLSPVLAIAGEQTAGTRINLSATADALQPSDEVVIAFRVEKQGRDASAVRQHVNKVSAAIAQRLKRERGVTLKTTGRNMQPVWAYPKNSTRVRTGWKMVQNGQITSTRLNAVPGWLEAIEAAGANLSNLGFRVSHAVATRERESLRLQAIGDFRRKAKEVAKGLGGASFRIIRLSTSSHASQPRVYRAEMAMMAKAVADAPAPALSAVENRLSVTISGDIEVPYIDYPVQ